MTTGQPLPPLLSGEVYYLYAFDVASEIMTAKIQEILSEKPSSLTIRFDRSTPKDVPLYRPLFIEPPQSKHRVHGLAFRHQVRVYDVGAISVAIRVPFRDLALLELRSFHDPIMDHGMHLDAFAREVCAEVIRGLHGLLVKPTPLTEPEAYTVFSVTAVGDLRDLRGWAGAHERGIAALLNGSSAPEQLSPARVSDVMRVQVAFENTDLVVIDWNAALVVDLDGYVDEALYVLELANLQIEEFRVLDAQLDRDLDQAYDLLEPGGMRHPARSRDTLRHLRSMRVDFTKLADGINHIGKFFGDWYLAKVYLGARERFHLEAWRQSVDTRLERLDQLYSVLHSNIYDRRMFVMEAVIVFLFIIDLAALILLR